MSFFGEQLVLRRKRNKKELDYATQAIYDAATGQKHFHFSGSPDEWVRREMESIFFYFGLKVSVDMGECKDVMELIDTMSRPFAVMHRHVILNRIWWKNGDGPVLAMQKSSGRLVALLPSKAGGYYYKKPDSEKKIRITEKNKDDFEPDAMCFYKPFPLEPISDKAFLSLLAGSINSTDLLMVFVATLAVISISLLIPFMIEMVFSLIIPTGKRSMVASMALVLLVTAIAAYVITIFKQGFLDRLSGRLETYLMNAVMGRAVNFHTSFFEHKPTGELFRVFNCLKEVPNMLVSGVVAKVFEIVLSILFIAQIGIMAPQLLKPTLLTFLLQILIIVVCWREKSTRSAKEFAYDCKIEGLSLAVYNGIQRIRLSGSESKVMTRWSELYSRKAYYGYPPVFPTDFRKELITLATIMGTMYSYYMGYTLRLEVSQFAAFVTAFGLMNSNILSMSYTNDLTPMLMPTIELARDILTEVPEVSEEKKILHRLKGKVEIHNLSFRYDPDSPLVLNNINLKVRPGEYVALVGKSGCGKTTLMRLLMGFETATEGSIIIDDINVDRIDPRSLRHCIGAVMQDDSLLDGDVFSNIAISAPGIGIDEVWEIAEKVGLADDIRNMPLGMNTHISQGGIGISGGQKQRILIARALASKPKLMIFDEATSALDNVTQKIVSESLDKLNCTRIVIAHRLSTIKNCDRILVMDCGKIIEEGTYDSLINSDGFFADLVKRQQL